jgi:hypothetical protein
VTVGAAAFAGRNDDCFGWVVWHPAVKRTPATATGNMARIKILIYCETALIGLCAGASAMLLRDEIQGQRSPDEIAITVLSA